MAFKRSAVRSRLSPPKLRKPPSFPEFFFAFLRVFHQFSAFFEPLETKGVRETDRTGIVLELSSLRTFVELNNIGMIFLIATEKCRIKFRDGSHLHRILYVQIMFCHIHIRVTD